MPVSYSPKVAMNVTVVHAREKRSHIQLTICRIGPFGYDGLMRPISSGLITNTAPIVTKIKPKAGNVQAV